MPLTRFKLSSIADGGITAQKLSVDNLEIGGTEAAKMPVGTTAQRANSQVGDLRHNSDTGILEQYTSDGWQGISAPPILSSTDITNIEESDSTQTIVLTGSNFDTTATATLIDGDGGTLTPTSSTRNSSTQITIVYSGGDLIDSTVTDPLDVKVTNGSGLSATLEDQITIDASPTWTTSSGSLATEYVNEPIADITLSASDPEGESVTYSVTSGALPAGLSLNSSTGVISGTPTQTSTNYSSSGTTENFTVTADDGTGNTTARSFSILKKWYDGTSSANAARSVGQIWKDIGDSNVATTPTQYYLDPTGSGSSFQCYGIRQLSDLGTVPSGTTSHFKNLRGLNLVMYNNQDDDSLNESQYLLGTSDFYRTMEGLHGIRTSGYTGSIYWCVFAAGTLAFASRIHFNTTHQQWYDGTTSGGEIPEDPASYTGGDTADLEYMAVRTYWDVWDENYVVTNYNGLIRAVPYRATSTVYGNDASYGIHYKRLSSGEHYPWHGDPDDTGPITSTDYMTSGGYRYGSNTYTDAEAISAGAITSGSVYGTNGSAAATSKSFNNGAGADDYAGVQLKHYIFLHEGTDDT